MNDNSGQMPIQFYQIGQKRMIVRPLLKRKPRRPRRKKLNKGLKNKKLPKLTFFDPFGNVLILKRALTGILAAATYRRINIVNKTDVIGAEHLMDLPKNNVLFISNHQTYFADVMAFYHIFCSVKWRFKNLNLPLYLLVPRVRTYYIAAEETMKAGLLPKLFSYTGAVTIKRSWRYKGENVQRAADFRAPAKVKKALNFGWVITFPQGTTTPNAPVRKGTASMIKSFNPIVVPVKIDGFNQAFDKKGLRFREKGTKLSVVFKEPIHFKQETPIEEIQQFLEDHILS